jgi:hypothetical protein
MGESSAAFARRSNFGADKNVRKKIPVFSRRISFRELARLASPRKTDQFLAHLTGADARTARRWLSGESRATGDAFRAVTADILSRLDL